MSVRFILSPLLKITQIVGLRGYSLKPTVADTLLHTYPFVLMIYIVLQFGVNFIDLVFSRVLTKTEIIKVVSVSVFFGSETTAAVCALFVSWLKRDLNVKIVEKLLKIDNVWSKIGVYPKYSRVSWFLPFFTTFLIICCCFIFEFVYLWLYEPGKARSILMMHYSSRLIVWIDVCFFLAILKLIRGHYRRVNYQMIKLTKLAQGNAVVSQYQYTVEVLLKIHSTLRKLCKLHGYMHQFQLSIMVVFLVSAVTSYMYILYTSHIAYFVYLSRDRPFVVFNSYFLFWVVVKFLLTYLILDSIVSTKEEGNSTIELIQKLQLEVDQQYLNKFLKIFSRQIYDDKIEFSACGFFPLDFTLIHQVISSSSMYLIILLQFHFSKLHVKIINNLSS